jgi:tryptophan synthase alpha chain
MKRIDKKFRALRAEMRCGLIAYVTCGDPDVRTTIDIVRALEGAGADAIELGVPFSDPIADGPVIQAASFRALQRGTSIRDVLAIAREIRASSEIPLIAFSYINPILRFGIERFADAAGDAGINAVLTTDLPPESSGDFRRALHTRGVGAVFLLSPTSSDRRIALIDRTTDGFVYYVSTTGVTGVRSGLDPQLIDRLKEIRGKLEKPLAVGFGVSAAEHYTALAPHCDAVVVGSAIVRAIAAGEADSAPERAAAVVRRILGRDSGTREVAVVGAAAGGGKS